MSDYIKRSLVKAQFTGNFREDYPVSLCKTLIDEVPSADVEEVKHGKWIWNINSKGYYQYCSCCKEKPKSGMITKYCPNCGARMDLKE